MPHITSVPEVESMTDSIMGWFGFDQAYNYPFRPYAMIVACDLYAAGIRPDSLTREAIEEADGRADSRLTTMFTAIHGHYPSMRKGA